MGDTTDEQEKERRGAALLGELLIQLGSRASLRKKLAELEEKLGPAALGRVLEELERALAQIAVEKGSASGTEGKPVKRTEVSKKEIPTPSPNAPALDIPDPALRDPFADLLANLNLPGPDPLAGKKPISLSPPSEPIKKEKLEKPPQDGKTEPRAPLPSKEIPRVEKSPEGERVKVEPPLPPKPTPPPPPKSVEPPAASESDREQKKPSREEVDVAPQPHETRQGTVQPEEKRAAPIVLSNVLRKPEPPKEKPPEVSPAQSASKKKSDVSSYMPKSIPVRSTYPLEPEDVVYIHAVGQIPVDEKPAGEPFILEEKGIESKEFAFALDRGGLRFYLSRLTGKTTNVSKTGMLLLSRKEAIHLRGTHSSILNDLRVYGLLLPFEFGTVARGIEDLHAKIDEHVYDVRDALEEILATKWWEVCVYALDDTMMQFVAPDAPTTQRGERDRRGETRASAGGGRIDIKSLERVLNKQKTLAEEIHRQLENLAVRSDVDMMVNLSSGSSDDWKPILRASYEVGTPDIYRFNHAINDLQYHHIKYELMFILTGDREDFSFQQN